MPGGNGHDDVEGLLALIFASTPLLFIQQFLRENKQHNSAIRIGATRSEARDNLRQAISSNLINLRELTVWFRTVEGWGKQHLYIMKASRRGIAFSHLLNTRALGSFLKSQGITTESQDEPSSTLTISDVFVDDELARVTWRSHGLDYARHEDLDEVRLLDDGVYEFRAFRQVPRRSSSHLLIRKADGITLILLDIPLKGADHKALYGTINNVASRILAPLTLAPIHLAPIVSALDQNAITTYGRPRRQVALAVEPTQARFRTDGASVEFKSTAEGSGYAHSQPARHLRRALQVASFEGEAGKFHLTFEGAGRQPHDMIVSLHSFDNRVFLYSRMNESEVLALTDQLTSIR